MEFLPLEIKYEKVYAGFWVRFGASVVDMLVFLPFVAIFYFFESISIVSAVLTAIFSNVVFSIYTVYFHYRFGATLGKLVTGIRVTFPDGSKIGLRQALLRSSVDLVFAFFLMLAQIIAITDADPEKYLSVGWLERTEYLMFFFPAWYTALNVISQSWYWSEFLVLLLNKRKRAIHDFIAGTVVIHQEYTKQVASPDAVADIHASAK